MRMMMTKQGRRLEGQGGMNVSDSPENVCQRR